MRTPRTLATASVIGLALALAGCGSDSDDDASTAASGVATESFPVTVEHAYGETVVEAAPERVATVAWANHEVPLALGVVPVGMSEAAWGDDDGDGVLPWVEERLAELDAETPVLFDESDGIDFEAVADTQPDVILAGYSGLTEEEYDTLSKIAPTVAFPDAAWATSVQDMIRVNSAAMGMAAEGEELVAELEEDARDDFAEHPQLDGAKVLFTYIDPKDMSQIGFYTANDTRPGFLDWLGTDAPAVVAADTSDSFYTTISAEKADELDDVDLVVTYADDASFVDTLQADPLLSQVPAIAEGRVAVLPDSTPLAASANPSPLSVDETLEDYLALLAAAVDRGA